MSPLINNRTSRRRLGYGAVIATMALVALVGAALAFNAPLSNFEIDGDPSAGEQVGNAGGTTADGVDWARITGGAGGTEALVYDSGQPVDSDPAGGTNPSDNPAEPGTATFFRDDLKVDPDATTFTNGNKENDCVEVKNGVCETFSVGGTLTSKTPWDIVSGSVPPNKDDLFDIYTYSLISGSQADVVLGAIRTNNLGDSHIDYELNKLDWEPCVDDSATLCPRRSEGDILIAYEISNTTPTKVSFFVWDLPGGVNAGAGKRGASTSTDGCDGNLTGPNPTQPCPWEEVTFPASAVVSVLNSVAVSAPPWGSRTPNGAATTTIPEFGFFETFLDFDQLGFGPGCPGFSFASAKARSSTSVTSAMHDLAGPFKIDLNTCGKIKIIKNAIPDDARDFSYTTSGTGLSNFTLDDDGTNTGTGGDIKNEIEFTVAPGNYTVTETVPTGWSLTSLACTATGTGSSGAQDGTVPAKANIVVGNLGSVTCTYTNTKLATLIVEKQTFPDGATGNFTFTSSGTGADVPGFPGSITSPDDNVLSDGQSFTVANLDPANDYKIVESDPSPNFDLTSISCDDGSSTDASSGVVSTRTATFKLEPGETVKCTFTNTQRNSLIISKKAKDASTATTGNEPLGGVTFTISPNPQTGTGTLVVTDLFAAEASGTDQFRSATTGKGLICIDNVLTSITSFSITESVPTGYSVVGPNPKTSITSSVGTCASRGTSATANAAFVNEPLSNFTVTFVSQAAGANGTANSGSGATKAIITCKDENGTTLTLDSGTNDQTETYTNRLPNSTIDGTKVYTCTILIDP
ncbi:MAG TPA: hypothetical protein VFK38_05420 [Candidatus Limnocylindrales bacterium]|nr:hypothetical protein [Candidatus Limnocylindrales bacterium]